MVEPSRFRLPAIWSMMCPRDRPTAFGPGPDAAAHLGRDDDILALDAEVAQSLPELNLGLAFGIDIGGVDEIDARFERAADERRRASPGRACRSRARSRRRR